MDLTAWTLRLLPGAAAILVIGGAGFFLGSSVKQLKVDELNVRLEHYRKQLSDYKDLGDRIEKLKAAIDASMKEQNKALVEAYVQEMTRLRADFGVARSGLASATDELKKEGRKFRIDAASSPKLPIGSPEWMKFAGEALAIVSDGKKRQALCAVTPVADNQLADLKSSFAIGAK